MAETQDNGALRSGNQIDADTGLPWFEKHHVAISELLTALRCVLETIDDVHGESARMDCSSSARNLVGELRRLENELYEESHGHIGKDGANG